jgi:hypothetical protein
MVAKLRWRGRLRETERGRSTSPEDIRREDAPQLARSASTSILAVDFGNVYTRGILIDQVDGVYRLVGTGEARTTAGFPIGDASVGLARVVAAISAVTGRALWRPEGRLITPEQPDRSGVDVFVATASLGRRLRTVVLGLVPDVSVISAIRAAAGTYVEIVGTISLNDERSTQDQMNAIILARPDLIFITGGTDGGSDAPVVELGQLARLASRLMPRGHRPIILYAGNADLVPKLEPLFSDQVFFYADNVRPALDREALESAQAQLGAVFDSFSEGRIAGFERVGEMSRSGVLPSAQSYSLIAEFLGRTAGDTLIIDIGSAVSTIAAAVGGFASTSIRTDLGLGHSAASLLSVVGRESVRGWLPFIATDADIEAYAQNKTLRPALVPDRRRALYLEHALLRAGGQALLQAARPAWTRDTAYDSLDAPLPPFVQIIGAGAGITHSGQPGLSAMLLLDIAQPPGVTRLRVDPGGLIAGLGAVARTSPEAAVQVLDGASFDDLGTCFSVSGTPRANAPAVRVRVTNADGVSETHTIMGGELWIHPLPAGITATVRVRVVRRGLHIGGKRRLRLRVEGGSAGIMIDARGRPLALAANVRGLAAQLPAWYAQATGTTAYSIPDDWLTDRAVTNLPAATAPGSAPEPKRRTLEQVAKAAEKSRRRRKKDDAPSLSDLTAQGGRGVTLPEDVPAAAKARSRTDKRRRPAEEDDFPDLDSATSSQQKQKQSKGDDLDDLRNLFP